MSHRRNAHGPTASTSQRLRSVVILALAVLLAACSGSLDPTSQPGKVTEHLKIERYTLDNGLDVILHEDHTTPKAAVTFLVHTGSKDEPDRRSGFAHLFEHLMFMGTKRVPQGQYDKIIEAYGGENNAYTTPDMTVFYSTASARALPTLLWLEADRLDALGENIDQKKLDLQREVVLNERRQTTEDAPYGEADESVNQLIYPTSHPYNRGTIGSPTDLKAATVQDVKDFFAANYVPNNVTLVVGGNFATKTVKPMIQKLFGPLQRGNDVLRKDVPTIEPLGVKRVTFTDNVTDRRITMVWRIPGRSTEEFRELELAAQPMNSRLNASLVKAALASSASVSVDGQALGSTLRVVATAAGSTGMPELERAIDDELRDITKGLDVDKLQGAVTAAEAQETSDAQDIASRVVTIATDTFYFNDPYHSLRALDSRPSFSRSRVNKALRKYLDTNRLILTVEPSKGQPDAPLPKRPADAPSIAPALPAAKQFRLKNGVAVTYWQVGRFGTSYVQLVADQGSGSEKTKGSTALLAALLDRGSRTRDFDLATDRVGASISASYSSSQFVMSMSSLTRTLNSSLKLFSEAIEAPLLTNEEFNDEKSILSERLDARADDPWGLSYDLAVNAYYGQDNPYGVLLTGAQVRKVRLDDVTARRNELVQPVNISVLMAGNLTPDQARSHLEKTIGKWKNTGTKRADDVTPTPRLSAPRLLVVDAPGAAQTVIRVFSPAVKASDPNALPLEVLGTVLGGTFTSRLNANLREDKGYTYGASASYSYDRNFGFLNTRTSVGATVTGKSIVEIQKEFAAIKKGVTSDEVTKAVQSQAAALLDVFSSPQSVVQTHADLMSVGQGPKNLLISYARLIHLRRADINPIASKAVDDLHAVWVLVGDRKVVEPQLAGLGLPEPQYITVPK